MSMSTTKTAKLNDNAREFQAGESIGFGMRFGVQYYDRETKKKEWTNYECAVFSNNDNQINFLRDNLIAGSIITVTAKTENIAQFDGQNGLILTIKLNDCNLDYVFNPNGQQSAPSNSAPRQSAPAPKGKYDDDIANYWALKTDAERNDAWMLLTSDVQQAIINSNK